MLGKRPEFLGLSDGVGEGAGFGEVVVVAEVGKGKDEREVVDGGREREVGREVMWVIGVAVIVVLESCGVDIS